MYPLVLFGNVKLVLLYTSSASNKSSLSYETNLHDDEIIILTIIIVKVMLANKHFKSNFLNARVCAFLLHMPHSTCAAASFQEGFQLNLYEQDPAPQCIAV